MNRAKGSRCFGAVLISTMLLGGCGYLLYPERVGQREGRIDPAVVALDAAGLLFGIIPGVIAFAVDLSTGTIYLPPGEKNIIERHENRRSSIVELPAQPVDPDSLHLDQDEIARKLTIELDRPVEPEDIRYYRMLDTPASPATIAAGLN